MKVKVISDVVCNNILGNIPDINGEKFDISFAPLDQFVPEILSCESEDFLVVHLTQFAFNSYHISVNYVESLKEITETIEKFISKSKCKVIINTLHFDQQSFTQPDDIQTQKLIFKCNGLLLKLAEDYPLDIILIDVANVITKFGGLDNLNFRNYGVMRAPYSKNLANAIREKYILHFYNYLNPRKKVLFLDADNTLWGGVVGEDGIDGRLYCLV